MEENEFECDAEMQKMQKIIAGYPGDPFIPEVYLIDYLLNYEGTGIESACSYVGMFFGYFYIQKCSSDISITEAINRLSRFLDHLAENGYAETDRCEAAKTEMKKNCY